MILSQTGDRLITFKVVTDRNMPITSGRVVSLKEAKTKVLEDHYTDLQRPSHQSQSEYFLLFHPQNYVYSLHTVKGGSELCSYKGPTSIVSRSCILNNNPANVSDVSVTDRDALTLRLKTKMSWTNTIHYQISFRFRLFYFIWFKTLPILIC